MIYYVKVWKHFAFKQLELNYVTSDTKTSNFKISSVNEKLSKALSFYCFLRL